MEILRCYAFIMLLVNILMYVYSTGSENKEQPLLRIILALAIYVPILIFIIFS